MKYNNYFLQPIDYDKIHTLPIGSLLFVRHSPTHIQQYTITNNGLVSHIGDSIIDWFYLNDTYDYFIVHPRQKLLDKLNSYIINSDLPISQCIHNILDDYYQQTGNDIDLWQLEDDYVDNILDDFLIEDILNEKECE